MTQSAAEYRAPRITLLRSLYSRVVDHSTGSGWRIAALDGLRAAAALLVLAAHTFHYAADPRFDSPLFAWIERGGVGGVMLFFSLSGFLLYLPWLRAQAQGVARPRFSHYAARRCLRIMPAYYGSVVILAVGRVVIGGKEPISAASVLLHFLFLPTLSAPLLTVYWTVQVEEFFYWLLPAMDWVVRRSTVWWLLGATCIISATWAFAVFSCLPRSAQALWLEQTPFFLPAFAAGMLSAVAWERQRENPVLGARLLAAGVVGYLLFSPIAQLAARADRSLTWMVGLFMTPLMSCIVLGAALGGARFLAHPAARFVGGISFSIYLWHLVIVRKAPVPASISASFPLRTLYVLAISLTVSLIMYLLLERPFLMLRPKMLGRTAEPRRRDAAALPDAITRTAG